MNSPGLYPGDPVRPWKHAYDDRFGTKGNPLDTELRFAEHYLYAFTMTCDGGSKTDAEINTLGWLILGLFKYPFVSLFGGNVAVPSVEELMWGMIGSSDGHWSHKKSTLK